MELFGLAWLGCAIGAGAIASSKGRSGIGYFVLGLVLPLIGLLIAIGMAPVQADPASAGPRSGSDLVLCTSCGRAHRADASRCPKCGKSTLPPAAPATKKCPACAEVILAEAKKCKHCGEMLQETPLPAPHSGPRSNWSKVDEVERSLNQHR